MSRYYYQPSSRVSKPAASTISGYNAPRTTQPAGHHRNTRSSSFDHLVTGYPSSGNAKYASIPITHTSTKAAASKSVHPGSAVSATAQVQPTATKLPREEEQTQPLELPESLYNLLLQVKDYRLLLRDTAFKNALLRVAKDMKMGMTQKTTQDESETIRELQEELQVAKTTIATLNSKMSSQVSTSSGSKGDKRRIQELEETVQYYHKQAQKMQLEVQTLEKDKNDLLRRLSKIAGTKLADNNPSITDLSDPNRPQKLAEKMSQLYDDKWSDALEQLQQQNRSFTEQQLTQHLLNIFVNCFELCQNLSSDHLLLVIQHLLYPTSIGDRAPKPQVQIGDVPQELSKTMKEVRKTRVKEFIPYLYQKAEQSGDLLKRAFSDRCTQAYTKACLELCWYCIVQDPPVLFRFDVQPGKEFDPNLYRHYDRSGKIVDYLVWPLMLLHDGGPVLCKGVVQPKKK